MLKQIKLYGEMRARFGKLHTLDVATPAEAVRPCAWFSLGSVRTSRSAWTHPSG